MMLEKYTSWFQASPIKGAIYTIFSVILAVFVFTTILVAPKYQTETTNDSYSPDPQPSEMASPSPSPLGPNTCMDYDGDVGAKFDIQKAQLKKNDNGSVLLSLEATWVDRIRLDSAHFFPVPLAEANGARLGLRLSSDFEQQDFVFVINRGRTYIPEWTSQEFDVKVTATDFGIDVTYWGSGIEKKTSSSFEWAVTAQDTSNAWDICPDQDYSDTLERLIPYRP
jgi:hypothetical protein